jgi:bisphosphoglycerate-independent phosphoglycerate mutase (AlkP superfamily)
MSKRPVVLVVMDGIGINEEEEGNAVKAAGNRYKFGVLWIYQAFGKESGRVV